MPFQEEQQAMLWIYSLLPNTSFLGIGSLDDGLCSASSYSQAAVMTRKKTAYGKTLVDLTACKRNWQVSLK